MTQAQEIIKQQLQADFETRDFQSVQSASCSHRQDRSKVLMSQP